MRHGIDITRSCTTARRPSVEHEQRVLDRLGRRRVEGFPLSPSRPVGVTLHLRPDDEEEDGDTNDNDAANGATDDGTHRGGVLVVV